MNPLIQFCKICLFCAVFLWGSVTAHAWVNGNGQGPVGQVSASRLWNMVEGAGFLLSAEGNSPWGDWCHDSVWKTSLGAAMGKMAWEDREPRGMDRACEAFLQNGAGDSGPENSYRRYFILESMRGPRGGADDAMWCIP